MVRSPAFVSIFITKGIMEQGFRTHQMKKISLTKGYALFDFKNELLQ